MNPIEPIFEHADRDDDSVLLETAAAPEDGALFIDASSSGVYLGTEDVVRLRDSLTAYLEAAPR